jgi:hypothetical protein
MPILRLGVMESRACGWGVRTPRLMLPECYGFGGRGIRLITAEWQVSTDEDISLGRSKVRQRASPLAVNITGRCALPHWRQTDVWLAPGRFVERTARTINGGQTLWVPYPEQAPLQCGLVAAQLLVAVSDCMSHPTMNCGRFGKTAMCPLSHSQIPPYKVLRSAAGGGMHGVGM